MMKKWFLIGVLLSDATAAFALGGTASYLANDELQNHVVMVLGSRGSACSGVIVAQNVVLTAGHCALGSPQLAVAYYEGKTPVLKNVVRSSVNPKADIALVRVIDLPSRFSPMELTDDNPTHYTLLGFGLQAARNEVNDGKLHAAEVDILPLSTTKTLHLGGANRDKAEMSDYLQVCKGDSGGGVFTFDMKLAGIVSATYNTGVKQGDTWSAVCGNTAQAVRIGAQREWINGVLNGWR